MLQLRDLPVKEHKLVETPSELVSAISKMFNFKGKKEAIIKVMKLVPLPIVIYDPEGDFEFNRFYAYQDAYHYDKKSDKYSFYKLYDMEPYGILGEEKMCEVRDFEIDTFRQRL